ncbi:MULTISPECIES: nicotinate-nucleotide adenylyltransferase [unclassified Jeotgalibaca]|uniref:nicotinate-nucleotide adenylyltransferase n=1 Tax=unclassified Jeotgalibaca TaxID=2621505 RepID=UPI003FCFD9D0
MPERRRVGILGGTFNPPHLGHLIMAEQAGKQLGLDKVCFMPDAEPPHVDRKPFIAGKHRAEMVRRSISGNALFELEDIELKRGGKSYTFETMKELTAKNPDTDYYFIIGGDMVEYLPKWYRIDELVTMVNFVGVARPGYPKTSAYPIIWVDSPEVAISSTEIRKMVKNGQSIRYVVPEEVEQYIMEEGLYLD